MGVTAIIDELVGYENAVSLLIFVAVVLLSYFYTRKPEGIPPGPKYTLPFIGDLPVLIGIDFLAALRKLRREHGNIFSLYIGRDLNIVLNGYETIHEAAVGNGNLFSGRPSVLENDDIGCGKKGFIFLHGPIWKNQRKFTHRRLQEFGFGKSSFESKILKEVECFINLLKKEVGQATDFHKYIQASVANVIFSIVCGKRHDYDDEHFQQLLTDTDENAKHFLKISVLLGTFPFLRYLPGDPLRLKPMRAIRDRWIEYYRNMYEEHVESLDETDPKDFFDMFILEMSKGDNPYFTVDQLSAVAREIFGADAETTATTIRWAILFLLKFGDIKARLQSDIDNIIPENRAPRLEDKAKLPYVEAFIMEVLRCANIVPLAIPHAVTSDDVVLQGYKIPKDTPIIFNLDSVLKDSDIFKNPLQFNPERFIDDDGNVFRPKELIPFGIGRRICLGEAVAKMELFLFLTAMIKQFDFVLPDGQSVPDMEGVLGITHAPQTI